MQEYPYKGLPISPAMIEVLIIELFNGQMIKRDIIVTKILQHHLDNGGLAPEAKDFSRSVKKALSNLLDKGDALNTAYGFWKIQKNDAPIPVQEVISEEVPIESIPTHATYGHGDYAVYLYYFPSYKQLSEMKGNKTWPCKIGRTDRDPLIRILSQSSTALPETPFVEFIIKTDNSSLLETMIHSILIIRSKQLKDSPGSEWFDTNPEEILSIIKYVRKDLL